MSQSQVGRLACQLNSKLQSLQTIVMACNQNKGKAGELEEFSIILKDTILFPTGGGQPNDLGFLLADNESIEVFDCIRVGMDAVHITRKPLTPGISVEIKLDWKRRFDHMQQHSGQHLISDFAESAFGWITFCWNMGKEKSYVEFSQVVPGPDELSKLEVLVNSFIRDAIPMELEEKPIGTDRPDSIPNDIKEGVIRNIKFGQFDGPCCGTHVSTTAEIQVVKFLGVDKVRGGNARVWFVCGNRALSTMSSSLKVEKDLNAILSCGPDQFATMVNKKLQSIKDLNKEKKKILVEMKELQKKIDSLAIKND
jgi:misacylated tRNA(Ala) deacylase